MNKIFGSISAMLLFYIFEALAFHHPPAPTKRSRRKPPSPLVVVDAIPTKLQSQVRSVAKALWGRERLQEVLSNSIITNQTLSGEATFLGTDFAERACIFENQSQEGDACAQHSLGLLLWNGYCGTKDEVSSARWHAAAAAQNHLDALAVLGGCLRTGTGVAPDVTLGLELIECSAREQNPTGVNKKAALEESEGNYNEAFRLYRTCPEPNALLLMNLGWCFMEGEGVEKDPMRAKELWRQSVAMSPDEGSEEAAWFLYQSYAREDPREARKWLKIAASLGFHEAVKEH